MDHEILATIFFHQAHKVHLHEFLQLMKKLIPDQMQKKMQEKGEWKEKRNTTVIYTINGIENLPSTQAKHMKCATALSDACITNI